jgi:anthranilate phosphoribosyltransferase
MLADLTGANLLRPSRQVAHFDVYLHRLIAGQNLTYQEAHDYMAAVLRLANDRQRSAQLGVLLNGFMGKPPTVDEALGVVDAALDLDGHRPADRPHHPFTGERVIGLAGSGKKGFKTPNVSTAAAIVAATAGVKVAKSASKATSSVAGSADTLHNLGVRLTASVPRTCEVMAQCNLAFFQIEQMVPRFDAAYGGLFFAPHVLSLAYPALILPIKTDHLMYGIAHPDVGLALNVLSHYHTDDLLVVASTPDNVRWLDEVGVIGETSIVGIRNGERGHTARLNMAEALGVGPHALDDIEQGVSPQQQAHLAVDILSGRASRALLDMVAVNAAILISFGTPETSLPAAFKLAQEILHTGAGLERLRQLVRCSGGDAAAVNRWL